MEWLIQPKVDISFHYNGQIDISAKLAASLGLSSGDFINFGANGHSVKKHPWGIAVRHGKLAKNNKPSYRRANCVKVTRLFTSEEQPIARFRIGEIRNGIAEIITRINYATD